MIVHSVKFDRAVINAHVSSRFAVRDDNAAERGTRGPAAIPAATGTKKAKELELAEPRAESPAIVELLGKISQGIENVQIQTEPLVKEMQSLSIRLATMIVDKLVGSSEWLPTRRLEHLLTDAFHRAENVVAVYVNPRDRDSLIPYLKDELQTSVEVKSDETILPGECRIEFSSHELISNLEYQMTEIRQRLLEVIHDGAE
jgi:flagellar biosynthesis/type III secretory pathway protein FliH